MPTANRSRLCLLRWISCCLGCGLALLTLLAASAVDKPSKLSTEKVRQLQTQYQQERAAAEKEGLAQKFSPEWYEQAAKLAKQGEDALAAGRLVEARASFRRARWDLPGLPPHLPPHVARIFGDGRLRFNGPVTALAYSTDGRRLATASSDGVVRVWDTGTGREVSQFAGHTGSVSALAFHPDGKSIASADKTSIDIKIWDAATGKLLKGLNRHTGGLEGLAF